MSEEDARRINVSRYLDNLRRLMSLAEADGKDTEAKAYSNALNMAKEYLK